MNRAGLKDPKSYFGLIAAAVILGGSFFVRQGALYTWSKTFKGWQPPPLQFYMEDVTAKSGIKSEYRGFKVNSAFWNVAPWFEAIGASVAVVDFNNDGWQDVVFNGTDRNTQNHFYRNNRDGTFTDVTDEAGITSAQIYGGTRMFFFDFDNDGAKDLFVQAYCPRLFRNKGSGTFSEVTSESKIGCGFTYGGANVLDYDEDGFLDLVLAPFMDYEMKWAPRDTHVMPDNLYDAANGRKVSVFHNDGRGRFFPEPGNLGIHHLGWTNAVGVYDIRGTGRQDLWFSTDFSSDKVYFNEGNKRFVPAFDSIQAVTFSRNGMNSEFADVDNDGHPLAFVSAIFVPDQEVTGNQLWKWTGEKRFRQIAEERGVSDCGWAWGAKFLDFDNDGRLDLFVGNGFVSANPKKAYWFGMATMSAADRSVHQDSRNWPPFGDASLSGYERACVYLNQGDHFIDVAASTPFANDVSDERGVALIDYLNNGSQSLVTSNIGSARLYKVDQINGHSWIGFKLVGTRSNRDAFGAKVTLVQSHRTLTRQLQPLNGYHSQSDDRIHFGLGNEPKIEKLTIEWPSHLRQEIDPRILDLNRYQTIIEPRQ